MHTVTVRHDNGHNRYGEHLGFHFKVSNSYHYGCEAPHYPVPAKIEYVIWEEEYPFFPLLVHDDIAGDCLRYVTDFQP